MFNENKLDPPSCLNCEHWQDTYSDKKKARRTVLWQGCEPDWGEKSCEISYVEKLWTDKASVGTLCDKHQSGAVPEVKEAIAAQCPEYIFSKKE